MYVRDEVRGGLGVKCKGGLFKKLDGRWGWKDGLEYYK